MPAEKRPRKDSVPCVAGSGYPTRALRGGVEIRAQRSGPSIVKSAPEAPEKQRA
jgi:hypothetical protein